MNSVRHVSMVDRDVALTLRVTERPKKLNPLNHRQQLQYAKGWTLGLTQC